MSVDPAVYALKVQLQVDAVSANDTLDSFGDSLATVEQDIANSAQKALSSIDTSAQGLAVSLEDVYSKTQDISNSAVDMEKSFTDTNSSVSDNLSNAIDQSKELQDQYLKYKDIVDLRDETLEQLNKELDISLENKGHLDDFYKTILKKNKGHEEENKQIEKESDAWKFIRGLLGDSTDQLKEMYTGFMRVLRVVQYIVGWIAKASQIQEEFVTNNYRLYGSMEGIVQDVRSLSLEYGVLEKEALAAYKALADVRTPREEIDKMAKMFVHMNRVTGISMESMAGYSKRMRSIGADAGSIELHFNRMQSAMRKFGLTTSEISGLLDDTSVSMARLNLLFDGDEGVMKFKEMQTAAFGMAKALGTSGEAIQKQINALTDDYGSMVLMAQAAGMSMTNGVTDMEDVLLAAGDAASAEYARLHALESDFEKGVGLDILRKTYGFVSEDALHAAVAIAKMKEEMGADWKGLAGSMDDVQNKLYESYTATQRASRSWEELKESSGQFFVELWVLLGIVLVPIIRWLTTLINMLTKVINRVTDFYDELRNNSVVSGFLQGFEEVYGFLGALVVIIGTVSYALGVFAFKFGFVGKVFRWFARGIASVSGTISSIIRSMGGVIQAVFEVIGKSIKALVDPLKGSIGPLLALGAAFMMVGAGMWLMANAMQTLEGVGWETIGQGIVMLAASIAIIVLAVWALAAISAAVAPVLPIMLAVGAVILMIGAAAWLMGAGLKMAAEALWDVHAAAVEPHSPPLYLALPMLALGILLLGWAALAAAPGLIFLAMVVMGVSLASSSLTPMLESLLGVIETLDGGKFVEFAKDFLAASWRISLGVAVLAPAIVLAILLIPLLLVVGVALMAAGAAFSVIATALTAAGVGLMAAAAIIYPAAVSLNAGLSMLAIGATLLAALDFRGLSRDLAYGAAWLIKASYPLLYASALMLPAGAAILAVGATIWAGGHLLKSGGYALWVAAYYLYDAAIKMHDSGLMISDGADLLISGAKRMFKAAALLTASAAPLGVAGLALIPAAAGLAAGLAAISTVSKGLMATGIALNDATAVFKKPADELTEVLNNLSDAVAGFHVDGLGEQMESLAGTLDQYAYRLEAASERINAAVETKAIPAMAEAESAGIKEAVQSEAITQVQLITSRDGEELAEADSTMAIMVETLQSIDDRLELMAADTTVKAILDVVSSALPGMAGDGDSELSSEMNAWMK